ncbi:MAG TPA: cation:proton antiporter [Patescibacteria group bacterium]|jgi:Kef-type K+ transport system membrane component KefB/voltage-gated potassium channel Kch|nr:cation:proton antiporter [Patescibacteria group bacterium]
MELTIFTQISLVIAVAAVISIIMRVLRQPLIMGYIVTGILVGPSVLDVVHAKEAFETFAEIGIALLLFIIGLGLNVGVIRNLGKVSLVTAGAILLLVGSAGHFAGLLLGFDNTTSILLGIALFFSSTIIILKVLSDKHELGRLYGQIAIGVILVDDVVATMALVVVAMLANGENNIATFTTLGAKALALGIGLAVMGMFVIPRIGKVLAKSSELLFLFSIGWGLSVASLFDIAGFSHEVGALFAGVSLAGLPYATEMAAKLKPLRDFFIVLFFVTLGELFTFGAIKESLVPALILSLIVMVGKPLFVMASLGWLRYTRLTSFKAAIHLSQISEFSIILIIFAATTGVVDQRAVPIITLVALITIGLSTYLMKYDDSIYRMLERHLKFFERKNLRKEHQRRATYPVILFGYHKGGHEFLEAFREMNQHYLVVDYNPEVIEHLEHQGIRHAYGDMTDEEFLEEINAARAELVVSTLDALDTNLATLKYLRRHNPHISFICHATSYEEAAQLYEHGASYVSLPHYIGSERISNFIKRHGMSHQALSSYRDRHLITIGRKALKSVETS